MTPQEQLRAELTGTFHKFFTTDDGSEMHRSTADEIAEAAAAQDAMPAGHQYATGPFASSAEVDAYERHQAIHNER